MPNPISLTELDNRQVEETKDPLSEYRAGLCELCAKGIKRCDHSSYGERHIVIEGDSWAESEHVACLAGSDTDLARRLAEFRARIVEVLAPDKEQPDDNLLVARAKDAIDLADENLIEENAELRKDRERLDFLLARQCRFPVQSVDGYIVQEWVGHTTGRGKTQREAIDAAIAGEKGKV